MENQFWAREGQTLRKHSEDVAINTAIKCADFECYDMGYAIGLLHDIGKYQETFQKRLKDNRIKINHAHCGSIYCKEQYEKCLSERNDWGALFWLVAQYCIAGHHTGLPDCGTVAGGQAGTLIHKNSKEYEDFSYFQKDLEDLLSKINVKMKPFECKSKDEFNMRISLLIRMVFSALKDSDIESAIGGTEQRETEDNTDYLQFYKKLQACIESIKKEKEVNNNQNQRSNIVNAVRQKCLKDCINKAKSPAGFFSLTVPTGGGKTLSSMAFALQHAIENGLKRIIYVIPYTSIIKQTADQFKEIFGDSNILEHHSNIDHLKDQKFVTDEEEEREKLLFQTWNSPIIVTTNVQFFESLFSSKVSKLRKIININKSVIIFDEAQKIPTNLMRPSILMLEALVKDYGCSVVFCTATQPRLDKFLKSSTITEIINGYEDIYKKLKRVEAQTLPPMDIDELTKIIDSHQSVLVIVNKRKTAKEIYDRLSGDKYHLSTLMTPEDRKCVLDEVKKRLKNHLPVKLVSTQLIEAGVDIDFGTVYRQSSGIDSIVQACGRCNREGRQDMGKAYVFKLIGDEIRDNDMKQQQSVGELILERYPDPISLEAIDEYYNQLYFIKGEDAFDTPNILKHMGLSKPMLAPLFSVEFESIAQKYKIIEDNTYDVIVLQDDQTEELLNSFIASPNRRMRQLLQNKTVSIYKYEFGTLFDAGFIRVVEVTDKFQIFVADCRANQSLYNKKTGLNLNPQAEAKFL